MENTFFGEWGKFRWSEWMEHSRRKKKQRLKNSTLGNTFYEVGQNDSENKMREKVLGF